MKIMRAGNCARSGRRGEMKRLSDVISAPSFARFRRFFDSRDIIFHNGRDMKRVTLGSTSQGAIAGVGALALGFTAYGVGQAGRGVAATAASIRATLPAGGGRGRGDA